jgi:hypothetical protein
MNAASAARLGCAALALATLGRPISSGAAIGPSDAACQARANDSAARLLECIRQGALRQHLIAFQQIANSNRGPDGHGNRDTGQPGYKASVAYVAALMRAAGYRVTIQRYIYKGFSLAGVPKFAAGGRSYQFSKEWFVARLSGGGTVTAPAQPVGALGDGCSPGDFARFVSGNIALLRRGACVFDAQVANAEAAGAAGVIIFNTRAEPREGDRQSKGSHGSGVAFPAFLSNEVRIPVIGVASYAVGADLYRRYVAGAAPTVHLDVRTLYDPSAVDYNLIADSPFGDPNRVVVVDAHLDSIYGAGMLDNASGSATIIEVALKMAKTRTRNQLRYIWFGGEELGLLGSAYYTTTLPAKELRRIAFDLDVDVTATPNYDILVADPEFARNVQNFPPNVVPGSQPGNRYFYKYFTAAGLISRPAPFGNDGTDSNSFALAGVPDTGILTEQDCCKSQHEVDLWGGFLGNYEGNIPSFDGGCVDRPNRWCDNLSNTDARVIEVVSKAVAYVTFKLAAAAL